MQKKIEIACIVIEHNNKEVKSRQSFRNGRFKKKMDVTDCNNNVALLNEDDKNNELQVYSIWIVYKVIYAYLKRKYTFTLMIGFTMYMRSNA